MTEAALSYAHGASNVPLIGETIGAHFDRTVARWGERPALVVRQQGVRWSYRELGEKVDAFAAGLLALGLQPGERIGIWSPNNAEWVVDAVRHRQGGADPGQHQPGLSAGGIGIRAEQGGLPRADHRDVVQDIGLCRHGQLRWRLSSAMRDPVTSTRRRFRR